jgi:hypothetical protein
MLIQLKDVDGEDVGLIETNTDSWETLNRVIREAVEYAEEITEDDDLDNQPILFFEYLERNGMTRVFIEGSVDVHIL